MTIYIASDHGGFELKGEIINFLDESMDVVVEDLGPFEFDAEDDYPQYAFAVAEKVADYDFSAEQADTDVVGILICKSGNGMAIAANKVKKIRAALCFSPEHATKAREHNSANILVLDSEYVPADKHLEIIQAFLDTPLATEERHLRRIAQIANYEQSHLQ